MNEKNLRPFDQMPAEEHRKLSQLGGIASGKARRKKREQTEAEKERERLEEERRKKEAAAIVERMLKRCRR